MPGSGSGSGAPASPGTGRSLNSVVLDLLQRTDDGWQSATTALSGATDALVDATLADASEPTTSYAGGHLKILDGALADQVRRVRESGFDRSTGTLTLGRAYGSAPAAGVAYQYSSKLPFALLVQCVNWALQEAYFVRTEVIVPASTDQVTLPSWITQREQLVDVVGRRGATADCYAYYPIHHVALVEDAGTVPGQSDPALKVTLTPRVPDTDRIVVQAVSAYPALAAGADTTSMPVEWLRAGTLFQYYDLLVARAGKEDAARYAAQAKTWFGRWATLSALHQPNPASRLQLPTPFSPYANASTADPWAWAR